MMTCLLWRCFAADVERADHPDLVGEPLLLVDEAAVPPRLLAVSVEALARGVTPGLPLAQALARCPQGRALPARIERYAEAAEGLAERLLALSPVVELAHDPQAATLWAVVDETPAVRSGHALADAARLGLAAREQGLIPAIGLGSNRFVAQVAASLAEAGEALCVGRGEEATFLAPLPVALLPLEEEAQRWLRLLGLRTLGQVAALPPGALGGQLGAQGARLRDLALGADPQPLSPYRPREVLRLARHPEDPLRSWGEAEQLLERMALTLADRLRLGGLACRRVSLTLHLEDGSERQGSIAPREPLAGSAGLTRILRDLARQAFLSPMAEVTCGVAGIEAVLEGVLPASGRQLDLFAHGDGQMERLQQVLRDLATRHGPGCFYRVSWLDGEVPLPERRFRLEEPQ